MVVRLYPRPGTVGGVPEDCFLIRRGDVEVKDDSKVRWWLRPHGALPRAAGDAADLERLVVARPARVPDREVVAW
jgi:hypothetical protein